MPGAAAAETGDIPPAVVSPALQRLGAALPAVPARRAILFEAWAAPAWGIFRELKLVVRMTYGAASNDVHIDAALLYPDAEIAAARASGWAEFWGAFVEESPESFDRDSAAIRRDGATLVRKPARHHVDARQPRGAPTEHELSLGVPLVRPHARQNPSGGPAPLQSGRWKHRMAPVDVTRSQPSAPIRCITSVPLAA